MKTLIRKLREIDEVVAPTYASIHLNNDKKQKTLLGGFTSLLVLGFLFYMGITKGVQMLGLKDPYIKSIPETMEYETIGAVTLNDLSQPLFEILEFSDSTVDLEKENFKQFIQVRLRNVIKAYSGDNKHLIERSEYYWMRPCDEEDFEKTEFEANYYKEIKGIRKQFCVEVPPGKSMPFIQGTRDSQYKKQDHAYIVYEIRKCTDELREEGDPECASQGLIDKWLSTKFATFKLLNTKIDFNSFDQVATRQNEVFLPSIPLAAGKFCDTGGRFRRNVFKRTDHWFITQTKINPFYDYVFYNSDCYVVDNSQKLLSELYFRFDVDQMEHKRIVLSFIDFVGTLGGVSTFLLSAFGWIVGSISSFNSTFQSISALYPIKNSHVPELFMESKSNDPHKPNLQKLKLPFSSQVLMYLTTKFALAPLLPCLKSDRITLFNRILSQGSEKMDKELNLVHLLSTQRRLLFDIKRLKKQLRPLRDDEEDEDSIIDIDPEPTALSLKSKTAVMPLDEDHDLEMASARKLVSHDGNRKTSPVSDDESSDEEIYVYPQEVVIQGRLILTDTVQPPPPPPPVEKNCRKDITEPSTAESKLTKKRKSLKKKKLVERKNSRH